MISLMEDGYAVAARTTISTVVPSVIAVKSKRLSKISTASQSIFFVSKTRVKLKRNKISQRSSKISQSKTERRMFKIRTKRTFPKLQIN